jgi:hypothetical protein
MRSSHAISKRRLGGGGHSGMFCEKSRNVQIYKYILSIFIYSYWSK